MKVSSVYGSGRSGVDRQAAGVFSGGTRLGVDVSSYMAQQRLRKKAADKPLKKSTNVINRIPEKPPTSPRLEMSDEEFLSSLSVRPSGVCYPKVDGTPLESARNYMMYLRRCLDGTRLDRIEINRGFHPVDFGCFHWFLISSDCDDFHVQDVREHCISNDWGIEDEWTLESRVSYWPDVREDVKHSNVVWVRFVFCADFALKDKCNDKSCVPFEIIFTPSRIPKEVTSWRTNGYPLAVDLCPGNCVVKGLGIMPNEERIRWMLSAKTEESKIKRIVTAARELALYASFRMMSYPSAVRCGF